MTTLQNLKTFSVLSIKLIKSKESVIYSDSIIIIFFKSNLSNTLKYEPMSDVGNLAKRYRMIK